ncbi:MAG: hypothetical protein HYU27_00270 [Acidobacteria bacterium]|nr:hypothetical protein [Acidobacteriota bacterium]
MKPKQALTNAVTKPSPAVLTPDLRELILPAHRTVARGANAALVTLYWQAGQRLRTEVLKVDRAEYGEEIQRSFRQCRKD